MIKKYVIWFFDILISLVVVGLMMFDSVYRQEWIFILLVLLVVMIPAISRIVVYLLEKKSVGLVNR